MLASMTTRIGILVFDDVDLLDVGGPYEVFLTATRLAVRRGRPAPFEVAVVGVTGDPVTAYGGMGLVPTHTVADMGPIDVAVIPGAIDINRVAADESNGDAVAALVSAAAVASQRLHRGVPARGRRLARRPAVDHALGGCRRSCCTDR